MSTNNPNILRDSTSPEFNCPSGCLSREDCKNSTLIRALGESVVNVSHATDPSDSFSRIVYSDKVVGNLAETMRGIHELLTKSCLRYNQSLFDETNAVDEGEG